MNTKKCPKCGKELPVESIFCPYCMEKFNLTETKDDNKGMKKLLVICACVLLCVIVVVTGVVVVITSVNNNDRTAQTSSVSDNKANVDSKDDKDNSKEAVESQSSGADTEVGLRNIKVDSKGVTTEEQKLVAQYFDNDYINITDYEFLARYPSIYEDTQICFTGTIEKIVKSTDNEYEMLVWVGRNEASFYYRNSNMGKTYDQYREETKNNLLVIKGTQTDTRLITGDAVIVYGRYNKIETQTIDGTSYTIPTVKAYRTFFDNQGWSDPIKYDEAFIKKVATALFGKDIEVRNAKDGEDYDSGAGMMNCNFADYPFMICEPENQSNARFTKYRMYMTEGVIEDAKSRSQVGGTGTSVDDSEIIRQIEFAADFEHYFIYTFDTSLNTMSVAYYDNDFKKIWQRDFDETINGVYDYTINNFYIVANNDLYIIDVETGEDVISPSFVGEKYDIRKVSDGIIMLSEEKSDTVMKVDLNGEIVWKTNVMNDYYFGTRKTTQFVDDEIIITNCWLSLELDAKTGEIKTTGEHIN